MSQHAAQASEVKADEALQGQAFLRYTQPMPTNRRSFRLSVFSAFEGGTWRVPGLPTVRLVTAGIGALIGTVANSALAQDAVQSREDAVVDEESAEAAEPSGDTENTDEAEERAAQSSDETETGGSEGSESLDEDEDAQPSERGISERQVPAASSTVDVDEGDATAATAELPEANETAADEAARAALVDAPEPGPSLMPLDLTTSTWTRFEMRENYDDLGVSRGRFQEGEIAVFRARLGIGSNPLPIADGSDVLVQFTPQASGLWGVNGTVGEANVGIFEGYFKIRSKRLDVQVGRQQMVYGDDVVIGTLDWHQTGRAFDGIRAHYKMDRGFLDLFVTQVAEGFPDGGSSFLGGDEFFWGAYLGIGRYFDEDMDLDGYFLVQSELRQEGLVEASTDTSYAREASHRMTGGLRVKNEVGWFDYRMEAGLQFGSAPGEAAEGFLGEEVAAVDVLAYQADLELGVTFPGQFRLAAEGLVASGDDPETERREGYDHLYPTGHIFLGLMDVIGDRTNVASGNLKLMRPITQSLDARIDGHVFFRIEDGAFGSPEADAGFAGTEVDAQLTQALGKFASIRALYGVFIPTSGHYRQDDVAHYFEMQSGVVF